jgi:hypothetical protein
MNSSPQKPSSLSYLLPPELLQRMNVIKMIVQFISAARSEAHKPRQISFNSITSKVN